MEQKSKIESRERLFSRIIDEYREKRKITPNIEKWFIALSKNDPEKAGEVLSELRMLGARADRNLLGLLSKIPSSTYGNPRFAQKVAPIVEEAASRHAPSDASDESVEPLEYVLGKLSEASEIAISVHQRIFDSAAHASWYWHNVWSFLEDHSGDKHIIMQYLPIIRSGFEKGAHEYPYYWYAVSTILENYPEFAKNLSHPFQNVLERLSVGQKGEVVIHTNAFFDAFDAFARAQPELVKNMLRESFDRGAHSLANFWHIFGRSQVLSALESLENHPLGSIARLALSARDRRPLTKDLVRRELGAYVDHEVVLPLYHLGSARGYYLAEVLRDPDLLHKYLMYARYAARVHGINKLGRRYFRRLYENMHVLDTAEMLRLNPYDFLKESSSIKSVVKRIRDEGLKKILESNRWLTEAIPETDLRERFFHVVSAVQYARSHYLAVRDLLQNYYTPERLFELKFGHYGVHNDLLAAAKKINEENVTVYSGKLDHVLRALSEEARNEGLYEKRAKNEEQHRFLETLKGVYERIMSEGEHAKIDPKELQILKNTKLANQLGVSETVSKILAVYDLKKNANASGVLKVALDPLDHMHFMNAPGSCQRPFGLYSRGAITSTGGPAIVMGAIDKHGKVRGRVVFYGYVNDKGDLLFVPNYSYGEIDIKDHAVKLLRKHGIPVHDDVNPPRGFRPAKSKHQYKEFWKDGLGRGERFE